tara:strand:- start:306 stop:551 length:246 start_codon:yes stop_codon:yes gene_type:complete
MIYKESDFKKLGFRNKKGGKTILEASAEISSGEYITIQLAVDNGDISFSSIEVQGSVANEKRKEYFKKYSLEEIYKLFSDY